MQESGRISIVEFERRVSSFESRAASDYRLSDANNSIIRTSYGSGVTSSSPIS